MPQAKKARHVRDMWRGAHEQTTFHMADFAAGSLVVFRRRYTINNKRIEIPGHIGIIAKVDDGATVIHANIQSGRVEEEPIRAIGAPMGCIAINLLDIEEGMIT